MGVETDIKKKKIKQKITIFVIGTHSHKKKNLKKTAIISDPKLFFKILRSHKCTF